MNVADHIAIVKQQGELLAAAARRASLDAPVPTCPGWTVRDLVQHVSGVHRWATAIVSRTRTENFDPFPELADNWPPDDALVDWFCEGHAALVDTLESALPDLECFTFLPAPSPLAFWARRQAYETGIHRVDAEGASGSITLFEPVAAVDGIEEMLFGFASRSRSKLLSATPRTLHIGATDAGCDWLVNISESRPRVTRGAAVADTSVTGTASDLFVLLWNRRSADGLDVRGDPSLLDLWREAVRVRWS